MKLNSLEQKIAEAAVAYYSGDPMMSDEEFDSLTDQLDPDHWMRSASGWGGSELLSIQEGKVEIEHQEFIGGLPKSKYAGEPFEEEFEITHKLDGITGVVYYDDEGNLENIVTRGDGKVGIRVDAKLNVPSSFLPGGVVRGEIVITYRNWIALQDDPKVERVYKHPRNAAAGIVNSTSRHLDKYLTFIAFDHYTSEHTNLFQRLEDLDMLEGSFKTVEIFYDHDKSNFDNVSALPNSSLPWKQVKGDYVVVDGSVWREIGTYQGGSHAFKYDNVASLATVNRVEWKPTTRGRLAPTVHFSAVELDGATITKASGKSAQFIIDNDIGIGTIIEVVRANNVIPDIVNIVSATAAHLPDPSLDYFLEGANFRMRKGRDLRNGLRDVCAKMILDRSNKGIAEKAINQYVILECDIWECRMNTEEKDGKTFRSVEQALAVAQARDWSFYELMIFSEIDGIGHRAAVSALEGTPTDRIRDLLCDSELYTELKSIYTPKSDFPKGYVSESEDTGQMKVCITGKVEGFTKKTFCEEYDLRLVDVKDAEVVIASDLNSAKAKKAVKLGIPIMSQSQFEESL